MGINSFGFGGANVHATLKSHDKQKIQRSDGQRRRLFIYASRTQEGVDRVLSLAEKQPSDIYLHKLLNESAHMSLTSHPYRGFTVLNGSDSNRNVKVGMKRCTRSTPEVSIYLKNGNSFFSQPLYMYDNKHYVR